MRMLNAAAAALILLCSPALPAEPSLLRAGMEAGDEASARTIIAQAREPLTRDLILWRMARRGEGDFESLSRLIAAHPDWPLQSTLRTTAERAMPQGLSAQRIRQFFSGGAPETLTGALRLASATTGAEAQRVLERAWGSLAGRTDEQAAFIAAHPRTARAGAARRLDELLWRGERALAGDLLPLVDGGHRALAQARLALQARRNGVDGLIETIPASLRNDPGLAHDRFVWRHRAGRDGDAAALIIAQSHSAAALGRPAEWGDRRERLARSLYTDGNVRSAYRVASSHHLTSGSEFAALEWLSGWIALRGLNEPKRAAGHFIRHWNAVETPISKGRGGYWIGRAFEAQGDKRQAERWYRAGAEHATSFYGQLAAEKVGIDLTAALRADPAPSNWARNPATQTDLAAAARALEQAGQAWEARFFGVAAGDRASDKAGVAALGAMAASMDRPDIAIRMSKDAVRRGIVEMSSYFPGYAPLKARGLAVEAALAHAISRTESELNPRAISHAGARGLMQLMPATAQKMSRDLGVSYNAAALTGDPAYNARLGTGYLRQMLDRWDGATILAAASYNAGPNRAEQWITRFGDPRAGRVDVLDWIESIPFSETRNYVQRVMEAYHVYRARFGETQPRSYLGALTGR